MFVEGRVVAIEVWDPICIPCSCVDLCPAKADTARILSTRRQLIQEQHNYSKHWSHIVGASGNPSLNCACVYCLTIVPGIDESLDLMRKIERRKRNFSLDLEKFIFHFSFYYWFLRFQNIYIFISLSTLDFWEWEENFYFLLLISENLKLKFSLILGTPGSCNKWCFWMKKVICRLKVHLFWKFLSLFWKNMSCRFLFVLSNLI